jgi:hypothetical protein
MRLSGQLHAVDTLLLGEIAPFAHVIGGWVVPRAILNTREDTYLLTLLGISQNYCDISPRSSHCSEMSYLPRVPFGFQALWCIATCRFEAIQLLVVPQLYATSTPSQYSFRVNDVQVLIISLV